MTIGAWRFLTLSVLSLVALNCGGNADRRRPSEVGGKSNGAGQSSNGGSIHSGGSASTLGGSSSSLVSGGATGGTVAAGGQGESGGTAGGPSSSDTGGLPATGGSSTSTGGSSSTSAIGGTAATGGLQNAGGTAAGGGGAMGGSSAVATSSSGGAGTGGKSASTLGGASTGGTIATGGAATGGKSSAASTGGTIGAGGTSSTGGAHTGGAYGTGGASCTGAGICGRGPTGIFCAQSNGTTGFINWQQWSAAFSDADGWKESQSLWATVQFPDVNGDGRADVCGRTSTGIVCGLAASSGGFATPTSWTSDYSDAAGWNASPSYWATIQFPDVNGDGKADVCGRAPDGIHCSLSNGTNGFGPASRWHDDFSDSANWNANEYYWGTIQFPDVNGDGKADICGRGYSGPRCALSNGVDGFGTVSAWQTDYSISAGWTTPDHWVTIQYPDVNGDGKADVCGRGGAGIACGISNGTDSFGTVAIWSSNYSDARAWDSSEIYWGSIQFPDINGDGKADVCGRGVLAVECALSSGTGFGTTANWATAFSDAAGFNGDATRWATVQYPDLNGDGMADICGRSSTGIICGLSTGTGFATAQWLGQYTDDNGWQSDRSYGATVQTPNLNVFGCTPVTKKSTYLRTARRIAPY
jgi:hypothetical protein